ncbi:MAG: hypothetical protein WC460_04750 [Patescibacteria group bacterium]
MKLINYLRNSLVYLKDFQELFLEKLIRLTIYGGALLLPLFFIPLTTQFLEYSKVILFYLLVVLGCIFWLVKIFITKKLNLQTKWLDIPIIIFLLVYFLASLFSFDAYQSFLGRYLQIDFSFLTFVFLTLFYFLTSRFIKTVQEIKTIFYCLTVSSLLLIISSVLGIFALNPLPSLLGNSANSFYFLVLLALIFNTALILLAKKKTTQILTFILSLVFLVSLFVTSNQNILLILILTIFFFILISSFRSQHFSNKLVITLTCLLFLTVLALILPVSNWLGLISPVQLSLPAAFGWQITKASLADNFILGVGPQNFAFSFFKYRPLAFNLTNLWQFSFAKNSNFWLEILNNTGALGLLIMIIILGSYFKKFFSFVKRFEILDSLSSERFYLAIIISTGLIALIIYGFLINFDFLSGYLLFLLLGLGVSLIQPVAWSKIFTNKYVLDLMVYALVILILCFGYFGFKIILADSYINQAIAKNYAALEDYNWSESKIQQAIKYNPLRLDYNLTLDNLLISKLVFAQKNGQSVEAENLLTQITNNLSAVMQKEKLSRDDYLALQQNYTALKNMGLPFIDQQKEILDKLLAFDPKNPELHIDRALLNFEQYDLLKQGKLQAADKQAAMAVLLKDVKSDLDTSLELKNNYVLGYFNLGLYYQEIGDEPQALLNIAKAFDLDPSQKLVVLSLKKLYLNQDKVDMAIEVLTKYLSLNPLDNEIRLELALIYRDNNKLDLTKAELNKILEMQPDNAQAKEILDKLE